MKCQYCGTDLKLDDNFCGSCGRIAKVIYYENGLLKKILPGPCCEYYSIRDIYYKARFIVSNGILYDLENSSSIQSISAPDFDDFNKSSLGVTGNLVYVLRMKASCLKSEGKIDLALTLLKKATEMMPISNILWTKDDYMRFPNWLLEIRENKEARKAISAIEALFKNFEIQYKNIELHNAELLETDLVEANYFFCCCDECTKYRGRVYSISGRDSRFPKKPHINKCDCSGLTFSPFIYGACEPIVNSFLNENVDIIKFSNRPFVVERTDYEKNIFKRQKELEKKEKEIDNLYAPFGERLAYLEEEHKKQYKWICDNLSDIAPKSLGGYTKMKNSNSKNFQKLVDEAAKKGKNIGSTQEERNEMKQLKELREKYSKEKMDLYFQKRR